MTMHPSINDYNEMKKPLEDVFIQIDDGGVRNKIPALSKYFSVCREMIKYTSPPKMNSDSKFPIGGKEDWILRVESVIEDFLWLLKLEHHRFWSQLMYQKNSMDGLVSFLQEGFPFYSLDLLPEDYEIVLFYHRVSHLCYLVVKRIMTRVESEREWISEKTYAKLLYNNFVISIPMLIDICAIYGMSNRAEVRNILQFIFKIQPLYKDDLNKMVANVKSVFASISEKFCDKNVLENEGAVKLSERKKIQSEISITFLEDILFYLLDISVSLCVFADLCPDVGVIMHFHKLEMTIASFYSQVLPNIGSHIKKICSGENFIVSYFNFVLKLNQIRFHLVKLFHLCLIVSMETSLSERHLENEEEQIREVIDSHLLVLSDCLGEKMFIKDYHTIYPIDIQLERFSNMSSHIDSIKIKFILDSLPKNNVNTASNSRQVQQDTNVKNVQRQDSSLAGPSASGQKEITSSNITSDLSLQSASDGIKELKEIFPHLGEGFLQKCLEYYNNATSSVLNSILENTLPEELTSLDPELPIIPKELQFESRPFPERVNVFDNDEFDIMTRDSIDKSRVHRGKKRSEYSDLAEMLDDKCHVHSLKETYAKLGNTWVESDRDYDDEYDDSYDSVPVPVEEVGDERREFVVPRVLRSQQHHKIEEDNEEDEEEEDNSEDKKLSNGGFVPFVENPELVRARWEQKRNSQPQRQYAGRPKGQGQDGDVLFNRHKKNTNKSYIGNHNRRKMANHKRSQGVIPS